MMKRHLGPVVRWVVVPSMFAATCSLAMISCSNRDNTAAPPDQLPGSAATPTPTMTTGSQPPHVPRPFPVPFPYPVPYPYPVLHIPEGTYGGENIQVNVHDTWVEFKFACAGGRVDHRMQINQSGEFDDDGSFTSMSGPVPQGGYPNVSARYVGTLDSHGHLNFDVLYDSSPGSSVDEKFEAVWDEPPTYTQVCALMSPSPSPSPSPSS